MNGDVRERPGPTVDVDATNAIVLNYTSGVACPDGLVAGRRRDVGRALRFAAHGIRSPITYASQTRCPVLILGGHFKTAHPWALQNRTARAW